MTLILLVFYLLLPPAPKPICALWLSVPASLADLAAACPEGIQLENYQVDFVNIWNDKVYCTSNATAIYSPYEACGFTESLDNFRMEIYKPAEQNGELLCSIKSYNNPPTRAEIDAACSWDALTAYDEGRAELRYISQEVEPETVSVEIPAPEYGTGLYNQPADANELSTSDELTWLAGRLIWHNQVKPNCEDGLSGLDPQTLAANPCGESAAAVSVTRWQNQYDADIYAAAQETGVPARLLKRILKVESQYWPLWDQRPAGEVGLAQITRSGADQYLRWYHPAYGYASAKEQAELQTAFLDTLRCAYCSLPEAVQKEHQNIYTYAKILKAYRYASTDWHTALVLWNGANYADKVEQNG